MGEQAGDGDVAPLGAGPGPAGVEPEGDDGDELLLVEALPVGKALGGKTVGVGGAAGAAVEPCEDGDDASSSSPPPLDRPAAQARSLLLC